MRMRIKRLIVPILTAAALLDAGAGLAQACAVCGLPPGDPQAHAFHVSVLFLMAAPYSICLIGAVVGYLAYRNARKRRRISSGSLPFRA